MYLVISMKVAKLKKTKEKKQVMNIEESEFTIKNLIKTLIIIFLVLAIFYFITVLVVKPLTQPKNTTPVQLDSSKITMGQLLTRKEENYYVLAVKDSAQLDLYSNLNYFDVYNNYIEKYSEKEEALKFYWIDMDDALNGAYWSDELDIDNYIINDDVLFRVSNGKLVKYFVGHDDIIKGLQDL